MDNKPVCISAVKNIVSVLLILFFIVSVAAVAWLFSRIALGMEPDLFGYRFYIIASDSMSPELYTGDVILSKTVNVYDIKEGDTVTFIGTSGSQEGLLITHKVVKAPYLYDGSYYIVTQGAKENAPLDNPVAVENIKSVMVCKLNILTAFFSVVKKPGGFMCLIFLPLLALAVIEINKKAKISAAEKIALFSADGKRKINTVHKADTYVKIPSADFTAAKDIKELR